MRIKTNFFALIILLIVSTSAWSQAFKFALFTDLHIQPTNPTAALDLQAAVADVNARNDIDFVIVNGDITEEGDFASLVHAKQMLDQLKVPFYASMGNHETKWSESGVTDFYKIFGNDRFAFEHKGYQFVGFTTGPIIKMGDGHIAPQDIAWVSEQLALFDPAKPRIVATHYPLLRGDIDNWYDMTDRLRKYNIIAVLSGHYHRNALLSYDGLHGIINRSTLRAKEPVGGYNIYEISDSLRIVEQKIGHAPRQWLALDLEKRQFEAPDQSIRPNFDINKNNKNAKVKWAKNIDVAIYSRPAFDKNRVYFGDDLGFMHCISARNGKDIWSYKTGSRIISSPEVSNNKVVFGSTDGNIYCLNAKNGQLIWQLSTEKAVMGTPLVSNDTVFIGGSDGHFRAIDLNTGKLHWTYNGVQGYVETQAADAGDKIIFGAWDSHLYALNKKDGSLAWKWNNGNTRMHFSPAAVLPVVAHGKVFVTAPDRFFTAIDINTGQTIWRTNEHQVRETVGLSTDKKMVLSRCMNDSVVAMCAMSDTPKKLWKTNAAYGYDHNPSMLIEQNGTIVFGTKNGLLHGIDLNTGEVKWRYKIGNSIINTIRFGKKNAFFVTSSGGDVVLMRFK